MKTQIFLFFFGIIVSATLIVSTPFSTFAESGSATGKPEGLRIDLLAFPDVEGRTEIRTLAPSFCWQNADGRRNSVQAAYQIQLVSGSPETQKGTGNNQTGRIIDTGRVESDCSTSVFLPESILNLKPFAEGEPWRWRVRVWSKTRSGNELTAESERVSDWSEYQAFRFGKNLKPFEVSFYPVTEYVRTAQGQKTDARTTFFDFSRAAFARIIVKAKVQKPETLIVRAGERVVRDENGTPHVNRKPAGSTRFAEYRLDVQPGQEVYEIQTRQDKRNTSGAAFLMPDYIGEVMPYRYAEIERTCDVGNSDSSGDPNKSGNSAKSADAAISVEQVCAVYLSFNESLLGSHRILTGRFKSDSQPLNRVWDLCRYSIKATSFLGVYVDGDRERIPYEGDALLNQLSHYAVEPEYSMARRTAEYLIFRPTWPTEWSLQIPQMFWYDYLYTGDTRAIAYYYDELKAKSMIQLAEPNGLISTRRGKVTPEFLRSIHFEHNRPNFRDIVDWPHKGLAGNENANSGETDGFVFNDFNAVVNAYHFFAINSMYNFAQILNRQEDAAFFQKRREQIRESYQQVFFDSERGVYKDGDQTDHASLHGNMFPLAFDLVPPEHVATVTNFVKSRKTACSVYGAQFLLEAIYNGNDGAYGLDRMTADDARGWLNMLRAGSTISMEAWDDRYKPNQDWNHAWGAAPANIIPRKLVGVEPLEPGCAKIRVKPQVGSLKTVEAQVPTIRGLVGVVIEQAGAGSGQSTYRLKVTIPWNVQAEVWIPAASGNSRLTCDGRPVSTENEKTVRWENGFFVIDDLGSGNWTLEVR